MRRAVFAATLLTPALALAQVAVIGPGREADVLALLAPYALGDEVAEGWTLEGVSIEPRAIEVRLRGDAEAAVVLHHVEGAEDHAASRTASFAIEERGGEAGAAARAAIVEAVRARDDGTFWDAALIVDGLEGPPPPDASPSSPWPTVLIAGAATLFVLVALIVERRRQRGSAST